MSGVSGHRQQVRRTSSRGSGRPAGYRRVRGARPSPGSRTPGCASSSGRAASGRFLKRKSEIHTVQGGGGFSFSVFPPSCFPHSRMLQRHIAPHTLCFMSQSAAPGQNRSARLHGSPEPCSGFHLFTSQETLDEVIAEVRRHKEEIAAERDFDVDSLRRDLREREERIPGWCPGSPEANKTLESHLHTTAAASRWLAGTLVGSLSHAPVHLLCAIRRTICWGRENGFQGKPAGPRECGIGPSEPRNAAQYSTATRKNIVEFVTPESTMETWSVSASSCTVIFCGSHWVQWIRSVEAWRRMTASSGARS